jgi:hypothetical protein
MDSWGDGENNNSSLKGAQILKLFAEDVSIRQDKG